MSEKRIDLSHLDEEYLLPEAPLPMNGMEFEAGQVSGGVQTVISMYITITHTSMKFEER